jgi:putative SOS response-associated peptidase YedK
MLSPPFTTPSKKRRCVVVADGFYEWRKVDKLPHYITLKSGELMAFAGL